MSSDRTALGDRMNCEYGDSRLPANLGHDGKGRRCRTCDTARKRAYKARKRTEAKAA